MKNLLLFCFVSLIVQNRPVFGTTHAELPHLVDSCIFAQDQNFFNLKTKSLVMDKIDLILKVGIRNLEWLNNINSFRSDKITFSDKSTISNSIPDPAPQTMSVVTISKIGLSNDYDEMLKILPGIMKDVLFDNKPYTSDTPIPYHDYLRYARWVNNIYGRAKFWKLKEPYIEEYKKNHALDIRGFYTLTKKIDNLTDKLKSFTSLNENEHTQIRDALMGICYNTEVNYETCNKNLTLSVQENNGDANFFLNIYIGSAREIYNKYFTISSKNRRSDIIWNSQNPFKAIIPFLEVDDQLKEFLHNIELAWEWNGWQLNLNYINTGENIPHINFEVGAWPHANKVGGNKITMDVNSSINEPSNQRTISHEFGHILGFPDCYVLFYDETLDAFISYRIDDSNIMCSSQTGHVQEIHFNELKKNYYKL